MPKVHFSQKAKSTASFQANVHQMSRIITRVHTKMIFYVLIALCDVSLFIIIVFKEGKVN